VQAPLPPARPSLVAPPPLPKNNDIADDEDMYCIPVQQGAAPAEVRSAFFDRNPLKETIAMRVTNSIHLGCSFLLPVGTANSVQTLKTELHLLLQP
jgi:hypothetical protein